MENNIDKQEDVELSENIFVIDGIVSQDTINNLNIKKETNEESDNKLANNEDYSEEQLPVSANASGTMIHSIKEEIIYIKHETVDIQELYDDTRNGSMAAKLEKSCDVQEVPPALEKYSTSIIKRRLKHGNVTEDSIKSHICSFCDESFEYLSHKKRHEITHRGVKPYSCNYCDKSFAHSSNKTEHERTDKTLFMQLL